MELAARTIALPTHRSAPSYYFEMSRITIRIKDSGPAIISPEDAPHVIILDANDVELKVAEGKPIKICRCGHSLKRPFCDGAHKTCGLDLSVVPQESYAPPATPTT